ncbi:Putative myosin heavy chain cardiac muscle isoform [Gryllus bimaculatus]|nr:Putative myosin heavy chain cardiac muscle isoform [Gryllus bimaculatus]
MRTVSQQLVRASARRPRAPQAGDAPLAPLPQKQLDHPEGGTDDKDLSAKTRMIQRPTVILKPQLRCCAFEETLAGAVPICFPSDGHGDQNEPSEIAANEGPAEYNAPQESQTRNLDRDKRDVHNAEMGKRSRLTSPSPQRNSRVHQKTTPISKNKFQSSSSSPSRRNSSSTSPHRQTCPSSHISVVLKKLSPDSKSSRNSKSRKESPSSAVEMSSTSERPSTSSPSNRIRHHPPRDVTSVLVTQIEKLNRYVDEIKEGGYFKKTPRKHTRSRRSLESEFKKTPKHSRSSSLSADVLSIEKLHNELSDKETQGVHGSQDSPLKHRHLRMETIPRIPSPTHLTWELPTPSYDQGNIIPGVQSLQELVRNLAAIKIQSLYRGYKARKSFVKLPCKSQDQEKPESNIQITPISEEKVINSQGSKLQEKLEVAKKEQVPEWLQPPPLLPCPYNFITAVRRKMGGFGSGSQNVGSPGSVHQEHKSVQTIGHKEVQTIEPAPVLSIEEAVQVPDDSENPADVEMHGNETPLGIREPVFEITHSNQKPLEVPSASLKRRNKGNRSSSSLVSDKEQQNEPKIKDKQTDLKPTSDLGEEFIESGSDHKTHSSQSSNNSKNNKKKSSEQSHSLVKQSNLSEDLQDAQKINKKLIPLSTVPKGNEVFKIDNISFTSLEHDKDSGDDTETNVSSIRSQVASEISSDHWILPQISDSRKLFEASNFPALKTPELALTRQQLKGKEEVSVHSAYGTSNAVNIMTPSNNELMQDLHKSGDTSSHSSVNVSKISEKAVQILLGETAFEDTIDEYILPHSGHASPVRDDNTGDEREQKNVNQNSQFNKHKQLNEVEEELSDHSNHVDESFNSENKVNLIDITSNKSVLESHVVLPDGVTKSSDSSSSKELQKHRSCASLSPTSHHSISKKSKSSHHSQKTLSHVSKNSLHEKEITSTALSVISGEKTGTSQSLFRLPHEGVQSDDGKTQLTSTVETLTSEPSILPGQVLPPAALHMQFRAELQLIDSLDTSYRHLERIENLHAVTMAQQSANNLATTLKSAVEGQQLAERFAKEREEFERVLRKAKRWNSSGSDDSASIDKSKSSQRDGKSVDPTIKTATSESSVAATEEYGDTGGFESSVSSSPKIVKEDSNVSYKRGGSPAEPVESLKSVQESMTAKSSTDGSTGHSFTSMSMDLEPDFSSAIGSHKILSESLPRVAQPPLVPLSVPAVLNPSSLNIQQTERLLQTEPILATTYFMYEQMLRHEELRAEEQATVLNMKERSLLDRARAAMALLEARKRELRAKGKEQQVPALKKKQRALILRLQHDREEVRRQRKAHAAAVEERRNALAQLQQRLLQLQLARHEHSRHQGSPESASKHGSSPVKASSNTASVSTDVPTKISSSTRGSVPVASNALEAASQTSSISATSVKSATQSQSLEEKILSYLKTLDSSKRRLSEHQKSLLANSLEELLHSQKKQDISAQTNSVPAFNSVLQDRGTSPVVVLEKTSPAEIAVSTTSATGGDEDSAVSPYAKSPQPSNSSVPEEIHTRASDSSSQDGKQPLEAESQTGSEVAHSQIQTRVSVSSEEVPEEVTVPNKRSQARPTLGRAVGQTRRHSAEALLRSISPLPPMPPSTQHKRRYSSGSDESVIYSQTETPSEQSDLEGRVSALLEQLRRRRMEADKLRREHKRTHRERLRAKEQSLLKQIQAYDEYIQKTREEIQKELDSSSVASASFSKPKIKQPCNASRSRDRLSLPLDLMAETAPDDTRGKTHKEKIQLLIEKQSSEVSEEVSKLSPLSHTVSENISIETTSVEDNNKSQGESTFHDELSAVEEVATGADESSYSSVVSDTGVSTAISVSSEKNSASKVPEDESLKSSSPETSVKVSIQSPEIDEEKEAKESHTSKTEDVSSKPEVRSQASELHSISPEEKSSVLEKVSDATNDGKMLIGATEEKSSDSSDEKSSVTVIDEKLSYISEEIPVAEISEEKSVSKISPSQEKTHSHISFEKSSSPLNIEKSETKSLSKQIEIEKQNKTDDYTESFEPSKSVEADLSNAEKSIDSLLIKKSLEKELEDSASEKGEEVQEEITEVPSYTSLAAEDTPGGETNLGDDEEEEEEEHQTISSGDISEEQSEPAHIIKVFISEKVNKESNKTDNNFGQETVQEVSQDEVECKEKTDELVETAVSTHIIEESSLSLQKTRHESGDKEENISEDKLSKERSHKLVDKITDDIFSRLLKDMLKTHIGKPATSETEEKTILKEHEEDKKEIIGSLENQTIDEYLDNALETFYKTDINDETFTKEDSLDICKESDAETNLNLTFDLLNEEMNDATNTILNILEKKKTITDGEQRSHLISSPDVLIQDVRRRVSEILAETSLNSSTHESPRLQDLLTTTYDVLSSPSPEDSILHPGLPSSPTHPGMGTDVWESSSFTAAVKEPYEQKRQ